MSLLSMLLGKDHNQEATRRLQAQLDHDFRVFAVKRMTEPGAPEYNEAISIEAGDFRIQRVRQPVQTQRRRLAYRQPAPQPALEPVVHQVQIGEGQPGLIRLPSGRYRKFGWQEWQLYQQQPNLLPPGFEVYQLPSPGVEIVNEEP